MPAIVRSAALTDVPAIVAIERHASTAPHWTAEQYNKLVKDGIVLLAEEAAQLHGFICATAISPDWEIENIVVASAFSRRGVADELMRSLIQRADHGAATSIHLEVRESNLPARSLYEKHKFQQAGCRRMYYKDPPEDAILYTRRFASRP
jgi:ribosomal-protein-alanine N-acetyltransferase